MSRRDHGTGTLEETATGWRYRLRGLPSGRRLDSQVYPTKEEAEAQLDAARYLLASGEAQEIATLGTWGLHWLDTRRHVNARREYGLWRLHVLPTALGRMAVGDVRLRHVRAWAEGLQEHRALVQVDGGQREKGQEPISIKTRRILVALVRRVLTACVEEELLTTNPAQELRLRWPDEDLTPGWGFLEEAEIHQILGCEAIPLSARLHYQWAMGSGARQSESWALRWRDLDLNTKRGTITRSGMRLTTKGGKPRPFPLLPLALDALMRWRDLAPSLHPDALVFPAVPRRGDPAQGRQRVEDDMGWADRRRGKQGLSLGHRTLAGIRAEITYHDFRHTCCAGLLRGYAALGIARPWTLDEVCDFIGHSSRQVTEIYAHIAGGGLADRAAQSVDWSRAGPRLVPPLPPAPTPPPTRESLAPARGLEPLTRWLTATGSSATEKDLGAVVDQSWTNSNQLAIDLLRKAAKGEVVDPNPLIQAVLGDLLGEPRVILALRALSGEPCAIDLASAVLDAQGAKAKERVG